VASSAKYFSSLDRKPVRASSLLGATDLVRQFMEAPEEGPKKLIFVGWQDSPHLSAEAQSELRKGILPHEVDREVDVT
jgi:hypothetical protein